MNIVSAVLRSVRPDRSRSESRGGGPFLHWVPDRPDDLRLAGSYLPPSPPEDRDTGRDGRPGR